MPELSTTLAFAAAAIALLLLPGPAVLFVVARSVEQGRRAGYASAGGGACGNMVHVIAAGFGLSAVLATSAFAFSIVKFAGAAYLIVLGIRTLMSSDDAHSISSVEPTPLRRVFRQAIVVTAFNPKTALFFVAFMPQFVDPARGAVAPQMLFLGTLFLGLGLCTDSAYATLAGSLGGFVRGSRRLRRGRRYFSGSVYLALGALAATTGHTNHAVPAPSTK